MYDDERRQEEQDRKRIEKMSLEQLRTELDERMRAKLIEAIEKLPERIDAHLDDCVYKIITASLGIKKDNWHDSKWEIDTHNSKSAIAIELGEHVMEQVKLAIPDFIKGLVVGDPRIPPIKTAYTKAYKHHLADLINSKTWEVAQSHANKRFIEIMEKISKRAVKKSILKDDENSDDDETTGPDDEQVEPDDEGSEEEKKEE